MVFFATQKQKKKKKEYIRIMVLNLMEIFIFFMVANILDVRGKK